MTEFCSDNPDGMKPWELVEARRRWQGWRVFAITMGDCYVGMAWVHIHRTGLGGRPNIQKAGKAAALLVKAVHHYQEGGLGRRAAVAWRWARLLHNARSRGAA